MITNLNLIRLTLSPNSPTYGVIMNDDIPVCVTVERPWLDNKRDISCIPEGTYNVVRHNGIKFKDVWILQNVPDRSGILIHAGNRSSDVQGCIAVGKSFDFGAVTTSQKTLELLRSILPKTFTLTIINPRKEIPWKT